MTDISAAPRVRCVVMQRNERTLLAPWLRHHARLFGYGALCVIDNGSDEPSVLATLRQAEGQGVQVIRRHASSADFLAKGEIVADIVRGWDREGRYDLAIPLDCDEFLGVMTDRLSLERADVLAAAAATCAEHGNFLTNRVLLNVANRPGYFMPQLVQRGLFRAGTIVALDHGFQAPVSDEPDRWVQTPFVHLHLHHRPSLAAQQEFARQKLRQVSGKASGAPAITPSPYLTMTQDEFQAIDRSGPDIYIPGVVPCFQATGIDPAPILGRGAMTIESSPPEGYLVHRADEQETRHVFARFDAGFYARHNPDVARDNVYGMWPLMHFLAHGWAEGRPAHPSDVLEIVITPDRA